MITEEVGTYFELLDSAHIIERAVVDVFKKNAGYKKHVRWLQGSLVWKCLRKTSRSSRNFQMLSSEAKDIQVEDFFVDCENVYHAFFHNYRTIVVVFQATE